MKTFLNELNFEEATGKYYPRLRRYCAGILGGYRDCDDILIECMTKVFINRRKIDIDTDQEWDNRFYRFLKVICGRLIIDKKRTSRSNEVQLDENYESISEKYNPERIFQRMVLFDILSDCIDHLTLDRQVIVIKHLEGLTFVDISMILQKPSKKVTRDFNSSKLILKECMTKKGVNVDEIYDFTV